MSTDDNTANATVAYPGGQIELPIVKATEGADGIALGKFLVSPSLTDPGSPIPRGAAGGIAGVRGPLGGAATDSRIETAPTREPVSAGLPK